MAASLARELGLPSRRERVQVAGGGIPALRVVAVGWATVDLDRTAAALGSLEFLPAAPDGLLGAAARSARSGHGQPDLVLLEPKTEGRLAASLAGRGEGPVALYLAVTNRLAALVGALAASGTRTRRGVGPLGPAVLLLDLPRTGPHLILVEPDAPAERRELRVPSSS